MKSKALGMIASPELVFWSLSMLRMLRALQQCGQRLRVLMMDATHHHPPPRGTRSPEQIQSRREQSQPRTLGYNCH